jgi:hypothetical protein
MNTRLLLLLFLALHRLAAQPAGEVVFMGRVVDAEQKSVKGARVILVGLSEARTDDDGLFRVSLPASVVEVQVELERYEVVYPRSGRAPVPRSAATPVVFEVKKMQGGEQERLVRQLRENVRKLENDKRFKENEIARLEKNMQDSIRTYQKLFDENGGRNSRLMDSLERKVQQLLASQEAALIKQKKEQLYGQITRTMLSFLDKAKNLRDALARIDDVFLSDAARIDFEKQVTAYNITRDSLYSLDKGFAESVRLFWNSDEADAKMAVIHELSIVQIHEGIMLPLNGSVINPVRDAATGQASRVAASKKARKGSRKALEQLAFPLLNLQLRIDELMGILAR